MNELKTLVDEMKVRGYSWKTIRAYWYINSRFLDHVKKSPRTVSAKDIKEYLSLQYDRKCSPATRHLMSSALKFYYETVLKRRFHLKHPKKSQKIGTVLSKEEVRKMIACTENPKHRLLLELLYGSGLRVGEAVRLRIDDIDTENRIAKMRQGKGRKDRFVHVSGRVITDLNQFTRKKEGYLFTSAQRPDKHITIRTAQQIVTHALRKAGIEKKASPHTLRASYATHLIQKGIGIEQVQELMGHARVETTRGYIRLNPQTALSVQSPLD